MPRFVFCLLCLLLALGLGDLGGKSPGRARLAGDAADASALGVPRFPFADGVVVSRNTVDFSLSFHAEAFSIESASHFLSSIESSRSLNRTEAHGNPFARTRHDPAFFQDNNGQDLRRLPASESPRPDNKTSSDQREKIALTALLEAASLRAAVETQMRSDVPPNGRDAPGRRSDDPRAGPVPFAGVWTA